MRRSGSATVLLCAALLLIGVAPGPGGAGGSPAAAATAQTPPNIVVIMVDDMRDDELTYMPWTRKLIREQGVRFVNSFAPYPLCCPARASVLSGLYTHNHRVFDVKPPWGFSSFRDRNTVATWLHHAGYATVYVGKYLNGYGTNPRPGRTSGKSLYYVPPGWTDWRASIDGGLAGSNPKEGGTYRFFDTTLSRNGKGFVNYRGRYQSRVYGRLSEQIIRRRAASDRPFFLYVSYTAPHHGLPREPDDPAPVRRSNGSTINIVTTARPDDVKGMFNRRITAAPGKSWKSPAGSFSAKPRYLRRLRPIEPAEWRAILKATRQRAEALWVVDRQVKRTVAALRASGELRRTYLLFTSDNGYFLGEQRMRQGKIYPHEPSLRVPLLMRGPGIHAGGRRTDPVTSMDLAPTLARCAGTDPERVIDGISVLGVARNGDRGWTRAVLTETGKLLGVARKTNEAGQPLSTGGVRDVRYAIGVRTRRYLYVDLANGDRELYDLATDPKEYRNLASDPGHANVRRQLAGVLADMRTCHGDSCRAALPAGLRSAP